MRNKIRGLVSAVTCQQGSWSVRHECVETQFAAFVFMVYVLRKSVTKTFQGNWHQFLSAHHPKFSLPIYSHVFQVVCFFQISNQNRFMLFPPSRTTFSAHLIVHHFNNNIWQGVPIIILVTSWEQKCHCNGTLCLDKLKDTGSRENHGWVCLTASRKQPAYDSKT